MSPPFTGIGTRVPSLVLGSILDGAYIYKERSSNTKNYRVRTSRIEEMGVTASHRNTPISIQHNNCFSRLLITRALRYMHV